MPAAAVRTDFAARLYDMLATTDAGNLFLSPFSIQVALAMCAVGARGETRKVMAELIGVPESIEEQNRQYAGLLKSINGEGERTIELATANALWGQQGYRFKPEFKKDVETFYDGAFNEVNFSAQPDEALRTINAWVSKKTSDKIKDLIKRSLINSDTRLVLTNAIYFKGRWEAEFEMAKTCDEDWHGPISVRRVPMMHQKGEFLYYSSDKLQALDLPYKGEQQSMLVVLPKKEDGLATMEANWSANDTYRKVTNRMDYQGPILVSLPRFKMETGCTLKSVLCSLGAELAFRDEADFSGISDEPLLISEVVHKAFVEVNEEGTEAAAATGLALTTSSRPPQPKVFKADHPFLFFIRDRNTNAVLFSGRVVDPT